MKLKTLIYSSIAAVCLATPAAYAQTLLAQWTFENLPSTFSYIPGAGVATTNFFADGGTQVGVAALTGWHNGNGTVTYSSPAGNPGRSFSSNGWTNNPVASTGDYYQAQVSTLGYQNIIVTFNQYSSSTGPGNFYLAYSTDGVNFTQFGEIYTVASGKWTSYTNDLSAVTAITNQPAVYIRLVDANTTSAGGATVTTSGTDRIDNFAVTGINPGQVTVTPMTQSTSIFFGDNVAFNVNGGGTPPISYQWYYPNLNAPLTDGNSTYGTISGATNSSLAMTFVDTNQAGNYYVVVTGNTGSATGQVSLAVSVRTPIVTTIAHLRTLLDPVTYAPTDMTNLYTVSGIVTTPVNMTSSGANVQFYMQDGMAGIVVYIGEGASLQPSLGDQVQVTGPLDQFYGQLELNMNALNPAQSISILSSGNPLPAPVLFDPANVGNPAYMKSIESSLVVVSNVFMEVGAGSFISGSTVNLTNLNNVVFPLYVSPYVYDVVANPIPTFAASITGVLAQHATSNIYTNGFQMVMTQYSDLVAGTPPTLPISLVTDYTAGTLTLSWSDSTFTLQSSTNVAGPYVDVPWAYSPFATNAAMSDVPAQFFRLSHTP